MLGPGWQTGQLSAALLSEQAAKAREEIHIQSFIAEVKAGLQS